MTVQVEQVMALVLARRAESEVLGRYVLTEVWEEVHQFLQAVLPSQEMALLLGEAICR